MFISDDNSQDGRMSSDAVGWAIERERESQRERARERERESRMIEMISRMATRQETSAIIGSPVLSLWWSLKACKMPSCLPSLALSADRPAEGASVGLAK